MKLKKAFTLAEAILTMTILGIIAATMVTTLKPSQYKQQGYDTLKKKVYAELDGVMQTFIVECCKDMKAKSVYQYNATTTCDRSTTASTNFGYQGGTNDYGVDVTKIFAKYMRGTNATAKATAVGTCPAKTNYTVLKLKNGVCIYFGANSIKVDVNGSQKPDEVGSDQMVLTVGDDGIVEDVDTAIGANGTW